MLDNSPGIAALGFTLSFLNLIFVPISVDVSYVTVGEMPSPLFELAFVEVTLIFWSSR